MRQLLQWQQQIAMSLRKVFSAGAQMVRQVNIVKQASFKDPKLQSPKAPKEQPTQTSLYLCILSWNPILYKYVLGYHKFVIEADVCSKLRGWWNMILSMASVTGSGNPTDVDLPDDTNSIPTYIGGNKWLGIRLGSEICSCVFPSSLLMVSMVVLVYWNYSDIWSCEAWLCWWSARSIQIVPWCNFIIRVWLFQSNFPV